MCPKLIFVKFGGVLFFKKKQYTEVTTINMYLLNVKGRQNIIIQCHGNYIEGEEFQPYT